MRKLKGMGISIIFISHFLEQIYTICDRITVLRDGSYVGEYEIKDLPRIELISKMMGKEIKEDQIESNVDKSVPKDENVIEFDHVTVPGNTESFGLHRTPVYSVSHSGIGIRFGNETVIQNLMADSFRKLEIGRHYGILPCDILAY